LPAYLLLFKLQCFDPFGRSKFFLIPFDGFLIARPKNKPKKGHFALSHPFPAFFLPAYRCMGLRDACLPVGRAGRRKKYRIK